MESTWNLRIFAKIDFYALRFRFLNESASWCFQQGEGPSLVKKDFSV